MESPAHGATIKEVRDDESARSAKVAPDADLYIRTGKTGGRRFLVSIDNAGAKPTLVALHL